MNMDKIRPEVIVQTDGRLIAVDPKSVATMGENVRQMGEMILQMGAMISTMQRRMDELETRQAKVTVLHGDVKRIQAMIRSRADELCRKFGLQDAESTKAVRAAIKKDVLKRWGVKDLHDLPDAALPVAESAIGGWVNTRMMMGMLTERRGRA